MAKTLVRELISAGVHFGHGVSRWNPKMAPFIFAKRGKIHIIDVKKTLKGVLIAKKLLAEVVASGKDVVFVGTKRQAQKAVQAVAEKCGMHFVSERWLGGTLTNFRTIRSRLQRLEQLEAMQADGTLDGESKKMASRLKREMRKVKANLDGIRNMSRLPGAVVVIDARKEYLALREAKKLAISTVGIIDTDSDPDAVDVAIPANDDSIRAVDLILNELAEAVAAGKTMVAARQEPVPRARRVRSRRPAMARARDERAEPAVPAEVSGAGPAEVEAKAEAAPPLQKAETEVAKEAVSPKKPKADVAKPPAASQRRKADVAKSTVAPKNTKAEVAKGTPVEPAKSGPPETKAKAKADVTEPAAAPKKARPDVARPPAAQEKTKAEPVAEKPEAEPAKSAVPERESEQSGS